MTLILRPTASAGTLTASSAYATGNVVGGLITFTPVVRAPNIGGVIHTAVLRDKAGQAGAYDLFLFDTAPAAPTNKAAIAMSAADLAKCIGVIPFPPVSLGAASTQGVSTVMGAGFTFKLSGGGQSLFGILVTRGTPTYASTSDVALDLVILPDQA